MTTASEHLLTLARRLAAAYATLPTLRAFMLTGSAAEGKSDFYSDLDMTAYYDTLPSDEALDAIREQLGGSARNWLLGSRDEGDFAESYNLNGVECQIGHTTLAAWDASMDEVLDKHNVDTPLHKAMEGTLKCIALYGEPQIEEWKVRIAAYPDGLAKAMVEQHLRLPAVWFLHDRLATRDATIWHYQSMVELAHNLIAILAGLNRLYFTTFQFKRQRAFIDSMTIKPANLADRVEAMFSEDHDRACLVAEQLAGDVLDLVDQHMPEMSTINARRRIGQRPQPWRLSDAGE